MCIPFSILCYILHAVCVCMFIYNNTHTIFMYNHNISVVVIFLYKYVLPIFCNCVSFINIRKGYIINLLVTLLELLYAYKHIVNSF